ncbi:reverse transcriptase domain-containing protein [Tanacetum coccineum]|uniref:Reverse transcriptase domain-containing protein n=1 Tax=Tanacetum coccineum TaxID=301880 RepID=A0ABQ5JCF9_9ASTR
MEQVMENGPWTIRLSPLILNIWNPNTKLQKEAVVSIPVWVKFRKVPIVAYSEVGLSHITSKLGKPIMLDSYTCEMRLNPWGRRNYARALIEMSSDQAFVKSLVVGIPLEDGSGHSMETIDVEYEWRPPHCGDCRTFGHNFNMCPKRVIEATVNSTKSTPKSVSKSANQVDNDGFVEVNNRKNKGKNHGKSTRIDGIRLTKPKASFFQEKKGPRKDQTQTTNQAKASTSSSAPSKNSTPMSNSFDALNNLVDEGINNPQDKDGGSVKTGFVAPVENIGLSSKATNVSSTPVSKNVNVTSTTTWECINESDIDDDDDVITSYGSSLGGGNQPEDEDFDLSDGYEAQVFDLPGQLKEFRDFKLYMHGRK